MKFPITRESLQAFDYAKEQEELKEEEIQKRLAIILDQLCREFKLNMQSNSKEKRFVWRQVRQITQIDQGSSGPGNMSMPKYMPSKDNVPGKDSIYEKAPHMGYLPQFIDKLKEVFIGCDIIVDPLKTYLIIDWS